MIFECSAIILVILVIAFMSYRYGAKIGWSTGMMPLIIVPLGHICGNWMKSFFGSIFGITPTTVWIAFDLISLVVTCLIIGAISLRIKKRKKRLAYLITCGGYSAILTCVLIVRSILVYY